MTLSRVTFGATVILSGISIYSELNSDDPDYGKVIQGGADIVFAGIGTFGGPIGAGVSLVYFGGRLFGWW